MAEAYFAFTCRPAPDEFIFKLTDDAKIEEARKILRGEEQETIHVVGRIIKRAVPYNPGWSYHLDPATVSFFAMAIEVCDASPPYVEDHLDEACGAFLPGCVWCPWSSTLTREVDGATAATTTSTAPAALQTKSLSSGRPGLKGTAFASGIDAVCGVPDNATDLYLFKDDQYLLYRTRDEQITSGPKSLASVWGVDGVFAKGVDDACRVPGGTGDLYFFKGDQYVRVR